jgi:hypothetical protein
MNVPDYVSPVVAYRAWLLGPRGLMSLNGEFWQPNQKLQAVCRRSVNHHTPPHGDCSCGIYAAKSFDQLRGIGYAELGVRGEVYLWGTVVEHKLGWRAQFAYPKTLVVGPESLLCGRLVQRDLCTEELESLKILIGYGADLFVAGEEGNVPLWTKQCGSFDHVREVAAREVVTVAIAVLMEDRQQQRLLQNGVEINHSAEITFNDAQFPLSPKDPVLHQIQHRNARVFVIDLDRTKFQVAVHLIELIRRMSGRIAVFVKNDVERPDAMRARLARLASQAYAPHIDPDGWLSCHRRNDVLSAFNSLKKRWTGRPPTGEANPPAVPVGSPRNRGPHSLPPGMVDPALEGGLLQHAGNWLAEDKGMF